MRTALTVGIFCLTYVLITTRRLGLLPIGRSAGALLGAVLMVATGAISTQDSYDAIDHDTIVLLFAMMLLTAYLARAGFFEWAARSVLSVCRTPWQVLVLLAIFSATLSAFLVNDTICIFMTPVVVAICRRAKLPMGPYLIALATSANIGSAATLVGNPQNMIIGSFSHYGFSRFLARSGPAVLAGLAIQVGLLALYYRRKLPAALERPGEAPAVLDRGRLALVTAVATGIVAGFFADLPIGLGWTTLAGVLILVLVDRKEPTEVFARVDWRLLVLFSSLFIVVKAFANTGLVTQAWGWAAPSMHLQKVGGIAAFTALLTGGSNLVSNVPMVLLAAPHLQSMGEAGLGDLGWAMTGFVTTVAGNLTIIGSVANIIVAEGAKEDYTLGFFEYLRFGLVSTVLVLAAGVPLIWLMVRWLG
jgi:Na+/H+ antiporter NhaD/arsenite permease-like protein